MYKSRQTKILLQALLILSIIIYTISPSKSSAIGSENILDDKQQIAILLPLSGPFADLGKSLQEGFEIGFDQRTDAIPTLRQYKISFLDSESNPETARSLISLLGSESKTVIAAGTPLNSTAWTASQTCEEIGLPYLIVGADQNNLINEKSVFSFRLTQPRSAVNKMFSAFIDSQDPTIQSIGIIYGENPCAIRQGRRLRKFCANKNLDLAIWETYRRNERNFYDLLNIIKERQPQLLFLATSPIASDKLWQQGQRLELIPPITIATPITCLTASNQPTATSRMDKQILFATPWPKPTNQENPPSPKNNLQAQGFAAAEIILESLNTSPNLTPGEIVKTLETTTMTTAYGQVNFSGPGLGHQNLMPWYLCSYDAEGNNKIVFPIPPDQKQTTHQSDTTMTQPAGKAQTDKPIQ